MTRNDWYFWMSVWQVLVIYLTGLMMGVGAGYLLGRYRRSNNGATNGGYR